MMIEWVLCLCHGSENKFPYTYTDIGLKESVPHFEWSRKDKHKKLYKIELQINCTYKNIESVDLKLFREGRNDNFLKDMPGHTVGAQGSWSFERKLNEAIP